MNGKRVLTLLILLALGLAGQPTHTARAATIAVTTTNDVLDAAASCAAVTLASLPGPDLSVSLREAICAANNHIGPDTISFSIPPGPMTIQPVSPLPILTDDGTTINGYSQPGASPADDETPATILIEIDGSFAGLGHGLTITSADNVIRGLAIHRVVGNGIFIGDSEGRLARNNLIAGNHIGTNAAGNIDLGNIFDGIFIGGGADNNTIGGDEPGERNVISGNGWSGVEIHSSGTTGNVVSGNYIGTQANGMNPLGNTQHGVRVYGGAQDNRIGGDTASERNIISGNQLDGIRITGEGTNQNTISGNYIGTTQYGIAAVGNGDYGVSITNGAQNNTLGGDMAGERNLISGNAEGGVHITDASTSNNIVSGNYIGADATGTAELGNDGGGVYLVDGAHHNLIGGDSQGERNLISGNVDGVTISDLGTMSNTVSGNFIGLDKNGEALGNLYNGIEIGNGAQQNVIGGELEGERNLISANGDNGVRLSEPDTNGNRILGNYIGTNPDGDAAVGNGSCGVLVDNGSQENEIGPYNLVSANYAGVCLIGAGTMDNVVLGNVIGLDIHRDIPLGNTYAGIGILDGAQNNTIGADIPEIYREETSNYIGGNTNSGVIISGAGTSGNILIANFIGGADGRENGEDGVHINAGATDNIIGPNNVIAFNAQNGVTVHGVGTIGNRITRNVMGYNHAYAINLDGSGNDEVEPPAITDVLATQDWVSLAGTTCAGCTVEFFSSVENEGEGNIYEGSLLADGSGNFSGTLGAMEYTYLTATTTHPVSGTSEFCEVHTFEVTYLQFLPLAIR